MKLPDSIAMTVFKTFCKYYQKRDLPALLDLFAPNCNLWGTGIDEYRVGLKEIEKQLKRDWSQSDKGEIEIVSFVGTPHDALWAAAVCTARVTINNVEHVFEHLRGTIQVVNDSGKWKMSHMHASFPDFRNSENSSFPV